MHPQRDRIVDAIMRGDSVRAIAKWTEPPIHFTAIDRYRRSTVVPALRKQGDIAKTLRENEILRQTVQDSGSVAAISAATKAVIVDDPILSRMEKKYSRYDRNIAKAEQNDNFSAVATLDAAETRAMTLHAQLTGRLQQNQSSGTLVQIAVLAAPDSTQPAVNVNIAEIGRKEG
jgi:hypothetical protein